MNRLKKIAFMLFLTSSLAQPALGFDIFEGVDINIFGGNKKVNEVLWENGPNQYIKYIDQDTSTFGGNDHPVQLSQKEIAISLSLLKIKGKSSTQPQEFRPIFTSGQAVLLSNNLAKGLNGAIPTKDIIFVLEKSEEKLMGLKTDSSFIAGRVFYKDKKLNIIIGDYNRARNRGYEAAYDPTNAGIVSYNFEHGQRSKSASGSSVFDKIILEIPGIKNQKEKKIRRDWFVIDVKLAAASYVSREKEAKKEEMVKKRREIEEILGRSIPVAVNPVPMLPKTVENRLMILNNLKEKSLITNEEYVEKRKKILDEL
jgi:hypothetical protein